HMSIASCNSISHYTYSLSHTTLFRSRYLPETKQDFLNIKGIGEKKYKQFGEQFNAILTQWIKDHPKEDKAIQINQDHFKQPTEKNELPSHRETYKLFQSGK